jgi:hypothetical protein
MALAIVRTVLLTVTEIQVLFTDAINDTIGVGNVRIFSQLDSVNDPEIISVSVADTIVTVTFRPLFPGVQYTVEFISTDTVPFQTVNGDFITEDGRRNKFFITSPGEEESPVRDSMIDNITKGVYAIEEPSLVRTIVSTIADQIQTSKDVLDTVKSSNYISVLVEDQPMTRDDGPIDRLPHGGVFEILRVATSATSATLSGELLFNEDRTNSFTADASTIVNSIIGTVTADPISLQSIDVITERVTSDSDEANYFDGMRIKVAHRPVIQVISVILIRDNLSIPYDIERFGYILQSNRYDTQTASINVNLTDSEIELSVSSLTGLAGGFLKPSASDEIIISYIHKRLGRDVDADTVIMSTVREAVREITPAIINYFSLDHAPIVLSTDVIPSSGGVEFINTQAADGNPPFTTTHPAFTREIRFDILRLPSKVGEYSINYETGEIYVFGEDITNKGTGESPPAATYLYRQTYTSNLDFTFNSDRDEFAIMSTRNIEGIEAKITFQYEDTFAKDEDFRVLSHVEVLNERINNRLTDDFKISTNSFPVTNVFRILNETTGELYNPVRFNNTSVTFSGNQAPRQRDITRERATFTRVPQEILFIADELESAIDLRVLVINLANNGIVDSQGRFVGTNFSSSLLFSREDIFVRERFFEDRLFDDVQTNIDRMQNVGDYMVDYNNGIIYIAASPTQDTDLGDITYVHKHITTLHSHILGVNNIYRSRSVLQSNVVTYTIGEISDLEVDVSNLEQVGERFISDNPTRPLIIGTHQNGEDGITTADSNIFTSNSAIFTTDDIQRTLLVGSADSPPSQEVRITGVINDKQVTVDTAFDDSGRGRVWTIIDTSEGAPKTITLEHDIVSVQNIYTVTQLGTLVASELDGYFDINRDLVSGNVITLGESNPLSVGEAIIVVYNYGDVFIDYRYLRDELVISYEYGNNSLDWSISGALNPEEEYFVTYRYGALREALLTNFGALTQIKELTTFSPNLNREVYRSVVNGTMQSFLEGPTIPSIERLVEAFTDVTPNITETAFSNWVLGRDFLHPRKVLTAKAATFDLGRFNNGIVIDDEQYIKVPALMHFKLNEGTLESWVRPTWKGLSNDATLTFNLTIDGYNEADRVFIGFSGQHPATMPFSLSIADTDINVFSEPSNIETETGFFIWFDEFADTWNIRWREDRLEEHSFSGTISTTGEFYNIVKPVGPDGYEINEITDTITSTIQSIEFNGFIDGYDALVNTDMNAMDGLAFASGNIHYLFDMAQSASANRVSIFKDGTGYLNFQVWDNSATHLPRAGLYNMSTSVRDWQANELHHIAVAWKFNTAFERDEMHLFVDGEEVPNLFKYGGNPKASALYDFGDVAEEIVITGSVKPIVGGFDGLTTTGSFLFRTEVTDFEERGIQVGDILHIIGDVPDGDGDPNFGLPYTVTGVGGNSITVNRAFVSTLGDLQFSVNQVTATVDTPVNFQDIIMVARDADGNETELIGVDGPEADYSIRRGDDHTHVLTINNGINAGDDAVIKPLGLIFRRCRARIYTYGSIDTIRMNGPAPVSLDDVSITAILIPRTLISTGGGFGLVGTIIGAQLVTLLQSFFESTCQPSNTVRGRKLDVILTGDNINYSIPGNQIIITGETYSGAVQEILTFTENGTMTTSEYWTRIDSVTVSIIPIDATQPVGIIEVRENKPITLSDNSGDFAEVVEYANGLFRLEVFGAGGVPYYLNACLYEIDYPSFLRIRLDGQPDVFYIGSDFAGTNNFDGTIDEFRILDDFSIDTRVGELLASGARSITTDYNAPQEFNPDNNAITLLHFDDDIEDSFRFIDRFESGFEVAPSVNERFVNAAKFDRGNSYIINNAGVIFNNNEGTIEFWISPLDDSKNDPNFHYYVDMSSVVQEDLTSVSSISVITNQRIRTVESVRLQSDVFNTGTNYFTGGFISNVDRRTITLGIPLPAQNVPLKVTYVPLSSRGDRVSIFRDPTGAINFFVKAFDVEHIISVPMSWDRHTWHRIMVMWRTNSLDNEDRLRLFVDGSERGTIRYGTGLIYGTGVVYGQAEVRPGVNRFLVDNIDLTDTFARIYVGSDVLGLNGARARLDNLRFSEIERLQSIRVTTNDTLDVNYTANLEFVNPVVSDVFTTGLFDFEKAEEIIRFLTTIINSERGIFRFEVEVIDSFDKVIGNTDLEQLLIKLINTIKPAHTEAIITFTE